MAQTGFTPILVYASGTATNVPLAANLTSSASGAELALNYADGKLYFKNSSGVVTLLASSATVAPVTTFSAGTTGFTPSTATSGAVTLAGTLATTNGGTGLTSFTANGVVYASSSSALTTGSALTFDGTNLGVSRINLGGTTATGTNAGELYLPNSAAIRWRNAAGSGYLNAIYVDGSNDLQLGGGGATNSTIFSVGGVGEAMRLTSTGLGIGTSSPADKLQVLGTIRFGANATYYGTITHDAASTGSNIYNHVDSGGHLFQVGGTTQLNLNNAGNLGLGVTPSAWSGAGRVIQFGNGSPSIGTQNNGDANFLHNAYESPAGTFKYITSGSGALRYQLDINNNVHKWHTAPSGTAGNAISFTQALTLDANRNLLLNGTSAGASSVGTLTIFNGTAPTGSVTDGVILFAADISSSSELRVRDEAGNVTTLSPHNFSLIPDGPSEEMAWAYYSEKGGKRINVDMLKLARMVEKLTGEKLVYES